MNTGYYTPPNWQPTTKIAIAAAINTDWQGMYDGKVQSIGSILFLNLSWPLGLSQPDHCQMPTLTRYQTVYVYFPYITRWNRYFTRATCITQHYQSIRNSTHSPIHSDWLITQYAIIAPIRQVAPHHNGVTPDRPTLDQIFIQTVSPYNLILANNAHLS